MTALSFLKLGGSMLTHKEQPSSARHDVIARAAAEVAQVRHDAPNTQLLLGHGSGSFGHFPAKKYNTRAGVQSDQQWQGFVEVWQQAAALNHLVMSALLQAGVPAIAFPPSAMAMAQEGRIARWDLQPVHAALAAGLVPVVYGDVAFDETRGGTILSTEDLFVHLAGALKPQRILLAGDEAGVFADFESAPKLIPHINAANYAEVAAGVRGAQAPDVTGGMAGKVQAMLALAQSLPGCEVRIFSGLEPGNIAASLAGQPSGTLISE